MRLERLEGTLGVPGRAAASDVKAHRGKACEHLRKSDDRPIIGLARRVRRVVEIPRDRDLAVTSVGPRCARRAGAHKSERVRLEHRTEGALGMGQHRGLRAACARLVAKRVDVIIHGLDDDRLLCVPGRNGARHVRPAARRQPRRQVQERGLFLGE